MFSETTFSTIVIEKVFFPFQMAYLPSKMLNYSSRHFQPLFLKICSCSLSRFLFLFVCFSFCFCFVFCQNSNLKWLSSILVVYMCNAKVKFNLHIKQMNINLICFLPVLSAKWHAKMENLTNASNFANLQDYSGMQEWRN